MLIQSNRKLINRFNEGNISSQLNTITHLTRTITHFGQFALKLDQSASCRRGMRFGDKLEPTLAHGCWWNYRDIRSCVSDDSDVEAAVREPQQRGQIRKGGATRRAIMCSVMWLLRLLTTCCLVYLSTSDFHTGMCLSYFHSTFVRGNFEFRSNLRIKLLRQARFDLKLCEERINCCRILNKVCYPKWLYSKFSFDYFLQWISHSAVSFRWESFQSLDDCDK